LLSTWCLIVVSGNAILSSCEMRAAVRMYKSEQLGKWNGLKVERRPRMGNIMPNDSHQRAAEFHELAAHAAWR
jgi:hypothetical protein